MQGQTNKDSTKIQLKRKAIEKQKQYEKREEL